MPILHVLGCLAVLFVVEQPEDKVLGTTNYLARFPREKKQTYQFFHRSSRDLGDMTTAIY